MNRRTKWGVGVAGSLALLVLMKPLVLGVVVLAGWLLAVAFLLGAAQQFRTTGVPFVTVSQLARTWRMDPARVTRLDRQVDVHAIRCPTLIIKGGESDILSAESAQKLQAAIPGSRLAVIPGAGHSVMGDNPAAFVEATRGFLATLGA